MARPVGVAQPTKLGEGKGNCTNQMSSPFWGRPGGKGKLGAKGATGEVKTERGIQKQKTWAGTAVSEGVWEEAALPLAVDENLARGGRVCT